MKRPQEHEYTSHVAYSRALEAYCNLLEQPAQDEPVDLETVYETIIQWDEGGGKRSRRELARRIVDLYTRSQQPAQDEPVAMRYDFDGYGWKYIDSGSGSDWQTRIKGAEPVYDRPQAREPQEPVECMCGICKLGKLTPLTDEQLRDVLKGTNDMIRNAMHGSFWPELEQACRAIEAAHGIGEKK